jgi:DNA-binding MarR family transcriptional regulator
METPQCIAPNKKDLFRKLAQRHPNLDLGGLELSATLKSVGKDIEESMELSLRDYGLSEGRFFVLVYLFSEELLGHDAPSPSDIAENLLVTRATITGLLDGLERDGYLERYHDNRDRRALTIYLTDKARQFMDSFIPEAASCANCALEVLNPDEQKTLMTLLTKLNGRVGMPAK